MLAGLALAGQTACGLKKEKIVAEGPIKVTVLPVAATSTASGRSYTGTVTSGDGADVSFSLPGTVKAVYVSEGQKVAKGQLLAELKDGTLQNNYNIARATLNEAEDAYNRFKKLHEAKALADMRWVEVQNTLEQARNAAEVARRALDDAKIYAPVSGIVAKRSIDAGQTVVPAIPAIKIVALGDVKVSIPVPENEIGNMTDGRMAEIKVEALGNKVLAGKLTEKGVEANPLTRAYDVKFSVSNPDGKLLPGMVCTVSLRGDSTAGKTSIVLPPQSVLLAADNRNFVWLAADGFARQRFIETSDITAEGIVVGSGIEPGDSVIVAGMQKVSDGTPVIAQI